MKRGMKKSELFPLPKPVQCVHLIMTFCNIVDEDIKWVKDCIKIIVGSTNWLVISKR